MRKIFISLLSILLALTIFGCNNSQSLFESEAKPRSKKQETASKIEDPSINKQLLSVDEIEDYSRNVKLTEVSSSNISSSPLYDELISYPTMQSGSYWCWAIVGQKIIATKKPKVLVTPQKLVPYDGNSSDIRKELRLISNGTAYLNIQQQDFMQKLETHLKESTNNNNAEIEKSYWGDMTLTIDYLHSLGIKVSSPVSNVTQTWHDGAGNLRYYFDKLSNAQFDVMDSHLDNGKILLCTVTPGRQDIGGHSIIILSRTNNGGYLYHDTWSGTNKTATKDEMMNGMYWNAMRSSAALKTFQVVG